MFSLFSSNEFPQAERARLHRIERKLDLILSHLGLSYQEAGGSNELEGRVRSLLAQGRKIEAIKVYREATGAGLRDAKEAVESYE